MKTCDRCGSFLDLILQVQEEDFTLLEYLCARCWCYKQERYAGTELQSILWETF